MTPLVDNKRPQLWRALRLVSSRYAGLWAMRDLPDWQVLAARRGTFSPQSPFFYMHAPKSASSSVRTLLLAALRARFADEPAHRLLLSGPEHWREALRRVEAPDVFRFSFVLHPVTRAVAVFNGFFVTGRHPYAWRHRRAAGKVGLRFGDASGANFSRFLDYVEAAIAESPDFCDPHFREQWRNLRPDEIAYDVIGRVENFDADITRIFGAIGLADFLEPQTLAQERLRGQRAEPYSRPSPAQTSRIEALYAEDLRRWW